MFDEHYPPRCASTVMRWAPTWSKQSDPSGRYVVSTALCAKRPLANMHDSAISTHNKKYDSAV